MARFFRYGKPHIPSQMCRIFLAFFWIAGLLLGICLYFAAGSFYSSVMPGALQGTVSIVSLLCISILPFLFSAFAVFASKPFLLLLICFWKAFQFSFVSLGVLCSFSGSGWLIRWFLMFSDMISLPLLYWFWVRHICAKRFLSGTEAFVIVSLFILIGSIDYCYISPFFTNLINS